MGSTATLDEIAAFRNLRARKWSIEKAAKEIGRSPRWGYSQEAKDRRAAEQREKTEGGNPKTYAELDGGVKDTLKDFNLFAETFLARRPVPWRLDAANRVVEWLTNKDDDTYAVLNMPPRAGKALALDTPLPTPTGWTTIKDVQIGDELLDESGNPCRVTFKSEVFYDHDCYEVSTDDGASVIADADHLWQVRLYGNGQYKFFPGSKTRRGGDGRTIKTTADLAKPRTKKPQLQVVAPFGLPEQELPIDPYVLGAWLGDGHSAGGRITTADPEILDEIRSAGYEVTNGSSPITFGVLGLQKQLRSLELLHNKHIPERYLRASKDQRLALLQGLIDTDGHVSPKGAVEYCGTNPRLVREVQELVLSLGVKASFKEGRATIDGRDCGAKYRVCFYMAEAARLPRKTERCRNGTRTPVRYLTVIPTESVPTQCIQVDSPSHLFLAGEGMLVTHNTTLFTLDIPLWLICGGGVQDPAIGRAVRILLGHRIEKESKKYVSFLRNVLEFAQPFYCSEQRRSAELVLGQAFGRFRPKKTLGELDVWRDNEFVVAQIGNRSIFQKDRTVCAASRDGGFLGTRVDLSVWDDLVTSETCRSIESAELINEWWENEAEERIEPGGVNLLVGQRLSNLDLYRYRLDKSLQDDKGENHKLYQHIIYPAHNEATCKNKGITEDCVQWDAHDKGCLLDAKRLPPRKLWQARTKERFRCTPGETPILMADWTDKPISEVKPGDWVMGFESRITESGQKREYRVPTQVESVHLIGIEPVVDITLESGHRMRSTPDHPWFHHGGCKKGYRPAIVGRRISVFDKPVYINPDELPDWHYLAGIMDGEGHIPFKSKSGDCVTIAQSKDNNAAVFAAIQSALDRLGVPYTLYEPSHGRQAHLFQIREGRAFLRRLLAAVPHFGKAEQAHAWLHRRGASMTGHSDRIATIEQTSTEPVYALVTGTHNYFAWGVPCHNTVYQQEDANPEDTLVQEAWINGGTDQDGFPAEGCLDTERGFHEWPENKTLIDYVCVDPSAANYWAFEWWAVDVEPPHTAYLIWGQRRRMLAGTDKGFLDINPATGEPVGWVEDLQTLSGKLGHPIRVWVVEANAAHRYLFGTNAYQVWRRRWPKVTVLDHQTQANKNSKDFGVRALLPYRYKVGLKRLPYKRGTDTLNYVRQKVAELTKWPHYQTDDTVMADWFGEVRRQDILSRSKSLHRTDYNLPQTDIPGMLEEVRVA